MKHVMLDLETMGTTPGSAIVAIGAVELGAKGLGEEFYQTISLDSCLRAGLCVDGSTIEWWLLQSEAARRALLHEKRTTIYYALSALAEWLGGDTKLWSNGANFDCVLLREAARICNVVWPVKYYNERCFRTLKELVHVEDEAHMGTAHNALNDARNQARHLVRIFQKLGTQ